MSGIPRGEEGNKAIPQQAAGNILAALPRAGRASFEALHAEHFPPRADDGQRYPLADLLAHLAEGERYGMTDLSTQCHAANRFDGRDRSATIGHEGAKPLPAR